VQLPRFILPFPAVLGCGQSNRRDWVQGFHVFRSVVMKRSLVLWNYELGLWVSHLWDDRRYILSMYSMIGNDTRQRSEDDWLGIFLICLWDSSDSESTFLFDALRLPIGLIDLWRCVMLTQFRVSLIPLRADSEQTITCFAWICSLDLLNESRRKWTESSELYPCQWHWHWSASASQISLMLIFCILWLTAYLTASIV